MTETSNHSAPIFRTEDKAAPGRLIIVHGFLNTWSGELGLEDLASPQSALRWLREAGLWKGQRTLLQQDLEQLQNYREALRRFVIDPASGAADVDDFVKKLTFHMAVNEDGTTDLRSTNEGVAGVIGALMEIVFASQVNGTWQRFKCCELETCGWAFYDHTKNRSGRWCSMKTCGSRHKARAYLRRKAEKD